jgi:hypothetical protein
MAPEDFHRRVIIVLWAVVVAIGLLLFWMAPARAHDWYDIDCCSNDDCRPVKPGEVEVWDDGECIGYRHIETGRLWCRGKSRIRPSKDGGDHLCWPTWAEKPNSCFYEGVRG